MYQIDYVYLPRIISAQHVHKTDSNHLRRTMTDKFVMEIKLAVYGCMHGHNDNKTQYTCSTQCFGSHIIVSRL